MLHRSVRIASAVGLVLVASSAGAQNGASQWDAWIGCWDLVPRNTYTENAPRVCVLPSTQPAVVDLVSLVGDSVTSRQRLDGSSSKREVREGDCVGTQQITPMRARVYLRTTLKCGAEDRLVNSVMAMTPGGEWLDVRGVAFGSNVGVRASRYRPTSASAKLPAQVASALGNRVYGNTEARIAVSGPIRLSDVTEASRYLEVGVLQTWLAEQGQGFQLDARQLDGLQKAGVAPSVVDIMVALSYPGVFALDRTRLGEPPPNVEGDRQVAGAYDEEYYDYYEYSRYGYDPYGYGYGRGYGWYSGRQPIVVVQRPADEEHGRVEKGRGYVSGRDDSARSGSSRSGGESGRASSGSGSSSDKSSGSSTGRKAKPKP